MPPRATGSKAWSSTSTRRARRCIITDHARAEAAKIRDRLLQRTGYELTEDEVLESPHVFIGSVDGLVAKIQDLRERLGISSFMTGEIDDLAPVVERLAGS